MAYRADLQKKCSGLTADETLTYCQTFLQDGFADNEAARQVCAEKVEAVHWYIFQHNSRSVIPACDTQKAWSYIEETYGQQRVNEYLEIGRTFARTSQSINQRIQAQWPQGAHGVIGPQYRPSSLSVEVLKLLAEASKILTFEVAKRDLEAIILDRLSKADSYTQRVLPKDVRKLLNMHQPKQLGAQDKTSQTYPEGEIEHSNGPEPQETPINCTRGDKGKTVLVNVAPLSPAPADSRRSKRLQSPISQEPQYFERGADVNRDHRRSKKKVRLARQKVNEGLLAFSHQPVESGQSATKPLPDHDDSSTNFSSDTPQSPSVSSGPIDSPQAIIPGPFDLQNYEGMHVTPESNQHRSRHTTSTIIQEETGVPDWNPLPDYGVNSPDSAADTAFVGTTGWDGIRRNTPATPTGRLPNTDLAGALESLAPHAWVSATAIQLVFDAIRPAYCRYVDSAFIPSDLNAAQQKPLLHFKGETRIWLPIHHGDHWSLAIIDLACHLITIHSSLQHPRYERESRERVEAFMKFLNRHDQYHEASWTQVETNTQQQNDFDCGLFLLISAFCDISAHAFPTQVHSAHWRHLFRCFLHPPEGDLEMCKVTLSEACLATLLTQDVRLEDVRAIHRLDQECSQLLTKANGDLQSTQECHDIFEAASNIFYPEQKRFQQEYTEQCQHYESQIALYQRLLDTLNTSDTQLSDSTIHEAIDQGNEATALKLADAEKRLINIRAKLDGWDAARETCANAWKKALESNDYARETFGRCLDLMQKAKSTQEEALAVTDGLLETAKTLIPNGKDCEIGR